METPPSACLPLPGRAGPHPQSAPTAPRPRPAPRPGTARPVVLCGRRLGGGRKQPPLELLIAPQAGGSGNAGQGARGFQRPWNPATQSPTASRGCRAGSLAHVPYGAVLGFPLHIYRLDDVANQLDSAAINAKQSSRLGPVRHQPRYRASDDTIDLSLVSEAITFSDLTFTALTDGTGTVITHSALGGSITVLGLDPTDFTADMFKRRGSSLPSNSSFSVSRNRLGHPSSPSTDTCRQRQPPTYWRCPALPRHRTLPAWLLQSRRGRQP